MAEAKVHADEDDEDGGRWNTATAGRQTLIPERYIQEISAFAMDTLYFESNYYQLLTYEDDKAHDYDDQEIACVGAGLGGGFVKTKELHVIKYK
jgi:hypothetical protein